MRHLAAAHGLLGGHTMKSALLAVLLSIACFACGGGPCGDSAITCWTSTPGCDPCSGKFCYTQYTGSGSCPAGYWCVDPREPLEDMGAFCPIDMASRIDLSVPIDMSEPD